MIKAIETVYNGYRFRSRLEARWAVFFDALGIKYEYEPEGFDLGKLGYYLPDFWLSELEWWVEVKGTFPTEDEIEKAAGLAHFGKKDVIISWINFDPKRVHWGLSFTTDKDGVFHSYETVALHRCEYCGGYDFRPVWINEQLAWCFCKCIFENDKTTARPMIWHDDSIINAYVAARQARFEHGETPKV